MDGIRTPAAQWTALLGAALFCMALGFGVTTSARVARRAAPEVTAVPGHREYEAYRNSVRQQLMARDYPALERTAEALARSKERFVGGDWKLHRFYQALEKPERSDEASDDTWQEQQEAVQRWATERPRSTAAHIAVAQAWVRYAWRARGHGFAHTVSSANWQLFQNRLDRARAELESVRSEADRGAQWYLVMQDVALGEGWSRAEYDALFADAVAVAPDYDPLYGAKALYLLPRWYGEPGDWERFADDSARTLGGREGSVLYATIAWDISGLFETGAFFRENAVSWPRIRQGYIDREALYGVSVRHLNQLALLAGGARDKETTAQAFLRIGDRWDEDVWQEQRFFEQFRRWAEK